MWRHGRHRTSDRPQPEKGSPNSWPCDPWITDLLLQHCETETLLFISQSVVLFCSSPNRLRQFVSFSVLVKFAFIFLSLGFINIYIYAYVYIYVNIYVYTHGVTFFFLSNQPNVCSIVQINKNNSENPILKSKCVSPQTTYYSNYHEDSLWSHDADLKQVWSLTDMRIKSCRSWGLLATWSHSKGDRHLSFLPHLVTDWPEPSDLRPVWRSCLLVVETVV